MTEGKLPNSGISNNTLKQRRKVVKARPKNTPAKSKFSRKHFFLGFGFSGIAVFSIGIGALLALSLSGTPLKQVRLTPEEEAVFNNEETVTFDNLNISKLSRPVNILVMGIKVLTTDVPNQKHEDVGYHALVNSFQGLSDSMLLIRFDPEQDHVSVLSIPRDTKSYVEGKGITKINSANQVGGPALAAESVSGLLNDVKIDRYVRINVQGIEKLIDALGGVNLYVPQDMKYTDHSQHLYIDLKQGQQRLNGDRALQFLRFRYDAYGDIGRVQRQQTFMRALIEQALNPKTILRLPDILDVVRSHLDTNLSTNELIAISAFAAQKSRSDVKMVMLPGDFNQPEEGQASYWLPHTSKIEQIMTEHFAVESDEFDYQIATTDNEFNPRRLKIAVQTNEENRENARQLVSYLRTNGYRGVYLTPQIYAKPLSETKIIAQQGDNLSAVKIRADLGLGEVLVQSTGVINSDITIQVGQDWDDSPFNPFYQEQNDDFQTISYENE